MAIRNVARGGGKAYKAEVVGLKELERKLKALLPDNPDMKADLYRMMYGAASEVSDQMRTNAQAAGWASHDIKDRQGRVLATGQQAIDSIFASARGSNGENPRQRISALAGVGKRRTMFEWIAGKHPRSPRAKVAPGNPVAMSLAAALEFGTSNRPGGFPAIRPAVTGAKDRVIKAISEGYSALLLKYSA